MDCRGLLFIFALLVVMQTFYSTQWRDNNLNSISRPIKSGDKQLVEEVTDVERRTSERDLEGAYTAFTGWHPTYGYYLGKNEENVENLLKILVLEISDEHAAKQRRYMLEHRWLLSFVKLFDEAVGWERRLQSGDASEAFHLALGIWHSDIISTTEDLLATLLRSHSIDRGSEEASFHFALETLQTGKDEFDRKAGVAALCLLADDGYGPAILEMIKYYSDRTEMDSLEEAYYWQIRALIDGIPVQSGFRDRVEQQLEEATKLFIRENAEAKEYIGC